MLAVVKTPRTEISIHGDGAAEILDYLQREFTVEILSTGDDDTMQIIDARHCRGESQQDAIASALCLLVGWRGVGWWGMPTTRAGRSAVWDFVCAAERCWLGLWCIVYSSCTSQKGFGGAALLGA